MSSGTASRSGANLTAIGATVAENSVTRDCAFALALVQYYDFLPTFSASEQADQIVDAIVYGPPKVDMSVPMITTFMRKSSKYNKPPH